jgi:hypothetical protein
MDKPAVDPVKFAQDVAKATNDPEFKKQAEIMKLWEQGKIDYATMRMYCG